MTRNAVPTRVVYQGSGDTDDFVVAADGEAIVYDSPSEIIIEERDANGNVTTLVEAIGYTLSGDPFDGGATATRDSGDLPLGSFWSIRREQPLSQDSDFELAPDWDASRTMVTTAFDHVVELIQEVNDKAERALKLDVFDIAYDAGNQKIINIANGTVAQDAATFGQLQSAIINTITTFDIAGLPILTVLDPANDRFVVWDASTMTHKSIVPNNMGFLVGAASSTDNAIARFDGVSGSVIQNSGVVISDVNDLTLTTSDTGGLGTAALMWSDVFLASGAVINFNNGDVTITHASDKLSFAGASAANGYNFDQGIKVTASVPQIDLTDSDTGGLARISGDSAGGSLTLSADAGNALGSSFINFSVDGTILAKINAGGLAPNTSDQLPLGTALLPWSDLFLASGAVINFSNGNATLTHSTGVLTSNVPFSLGTTNALTAGTIELGAVADTTISRVSAGKIAVEGVNLVTISSTDTLTNKSIDLATNTLTGTKSQFDTALSNDNFAYVGTTNTFTIGQIISASNPFLQLIDTDTNAVCSVGANSAAGTLQYYADSAGAAAGTQHEWYIDDTTTLQMVLTATALHPGVSDGAALGTSSVRWSDLFAATGFVFDINADWIATHSAGILTVGTGDLRITTAGTNAASAVTVGGTQTLTSKSLTSPTITGAPTATGATWTDLGSVTTIDINGGTIDGAAIGLSSASTGKFTTLTTTGDIELGAATDTTLHRVSAGVVSIEGNNIITANNLATGILTWLATPSSANLAAAITDEIGTAGALVFSVSPTFTGAPLAPTAANATNTTQIATTAYVLATRLDQLTAPTASVSLNSQKITNLLDPTGPQDAATKAYVDTVAQGLDAKASVRVATTTAGTLATAFANGQTVDGATLVTGNRIAIKNQAAPAENGIYTVNASGAPTRATDMDAWTEVPGAFVFVEEGTTNANTGWTVTSDTGGTIGTTAITWAQFSGAGSYTSGNGLTLTGTVFTIDTAITVDKTTAQTLTNKSLTSPTITASPTAAGATWTDLGTVTTIDINGGTLDGVVIGGASAAAATVTTLSVNTSAKPGSNDGAALGSTILNWSDLFLASGAVVNFNAGDVTITHAIDNLLFAGAASGYTFDAKIYPTTNDGAALGDTTHQFSDLFLAAGGVINWTNGGITITESSDALLFAGASLGYKFDAVIAPTTLDGAALGSAALQWSDLFLASGGVVSFASTDWVATHSTGILTVGTGDLRVTTAGTNAASVATVGGTQTLTNKILTAATITTGLTPTSDDGAALGTTVLKFSDLFLASGAVINFNAGDVTLTHATDSLTLAGGSFAVTGLVDMQQAVTLSGVISPTQITADTNDYAPTGFATATVLRLSTDASRNLTGLAGGANGRMVILRNVGANAIVLPDGSASSTAANRFKFGADFTLPAGQSIALQYDSTDSRWYHVITPGSSGGGGGGGAPVDAQYLTAVSNVDLTAERVATDTATVTWDFGTGGQAKANFANVFTADLLPSTDDGAALGSTTKKVSDIFLASGAVINFNSGNATLTHSAGLLTSNVPLSLGTSNALTAGTIELGAAADTTISRVSAGLIAVEGSNVLMASGIGVLVQAYDADLTTWAGITPGTGVGTALAVNVGSAGAFVTFNGALGTPSGGTLTNATGLPLTGLVSDTSTALGIGSINLGHASDTTIARVSAGVISVEGSNVLLASGIGSITQGYDVATLKSNSSATLTTGFQVTSDALGTISSGTVTPDPANRGLQDYTNNGAHTLAPSANNGTIVVDITNGASAGAITTSGFTKVTGNFVTTNAKTFRCFISIGVVGSHLFIQAMN